VACRIAGVALPTHPTVTRRRATPEGFPLDQPQLRLEILGEQPAAAALHDGVDEQPVLVDQPCLDQRVAERDAARDHDVLARLLLERPHLTSGVTGQDGGVLPPRVRHGRGDDVLLHPVEVVGDACGVVGQGGPVAAQVLEGSPSHEESIGPAVLPVHLLHQVRGVHVGPALGVEPVPEHLDRAVDGDVLRDRERAHGPPPYEQSKW
jgi:hypothetical protein